MEKVMIANAADNNWTGNKTDLIVDIVNNLQAQWSFRDYEWTINIKVWDEDRTKYDIKRDEMWVTYELEGDDWEDTVHTGHICLTGYSTMEGNELMCAVIRAAHAWICNHV